MHRQTTKEEGRIQLFLWRVTLVSRLPTNVHEIYCDISLSLSLSLLFFSTHACLQEIWWLMWPSRVTPANKKFSLCTLLYLLHFFCCGQTSSHLSFLVQVEDMKPSIFFSSIWVAFQNNNSRIHYREGNDVCFQARVMWVLCESMINPWPKVSSISTYHLYF